MVAETVPLDTLMLPLDELRIAFPCIAKILPPHMSIKPVEELTIVLLLDPLVVIKFPPDTLIVPVE